ncbi:MAG TPA: isoamylase early set domain-containing protein [Syntrophorhabdaceae bacterium]|nr:isoamylase early set domain-containing protein [Syntrophorhabdaceae bacterium]
MAKKDQGKKKTGKATQVNRSAKTVKTKAVRAKSPERPGVKKTQQKDTTHLRRKPGTTFTLRAPQASQVFVVGCFNEWNPMANPLVQDEDGTWSCSLYVEPGEHEYRFVVDGVWCDDPMNIMRRSNEFGTQNCIIVVEG